ncbi:MAG TPA: transcription termination/antitermination NusG family protein [Humisphaera sp.]|jgi:transcription antitermination factor NusG|nr:transcription termination/antitermination NusG family protein [Humisphaera sp.]
MQAADAMSSEAVAREPLFAHDNHLPWVVLHVKSRQEKALSRDLEGLGISHFLPIMRDKRRHGSQKAIVEVPVFPGYVFVRGTADEAYRADRTRRVARLIRVVDQRRLDDELWNLRLALREGAALTIHPKLASGIRVAIIAGAFEGLQGMVQDHQSLDRVILEVHILGRFVSLNVDACDVVPLE